jgi:hypothetical protein
MPFRSLPRRLVALALAAFVLGGCASLQTAGAADAEPPLAVDLMPRFFAFWDLAQQTPPADTVARVRAFREQVVEPYESFYARAAGQLTDERIATWLESVGTDVPAMRTISARLGTDLERYRRSFVDSLADFVWDGRVYFYPSLYMRDGGTMTIDGSTSLVFGVDMIARLNGAEADLTVLFHHELFHVYHAQRLRGMSGPQPLYRQVWREGLATYASQRLNPGRSELDVLLQDSTLADEGPAALPMLAREMLAQVDDTAPATASAWLLARRTRPEIPPRAGYLIGLRVAQLMGERRSLRELARLDGPELRTRMVEALEFLAGTPILGPAGTLRPPSSIEPP